jgi:thiosulfate reductase cytochrome b subunit
MVERGPSVPIHPLLVRMAHWTNAAAVLVMMLTGWRIYDASPFLPFTIPLGITFGGWLGGALLWHFAAMWLLVVNGCVYLAYGIATGRFRHKLLPVTGRAFVNDLWAALTLRLGHPDLSVYNSIQKLAYLGVLALLIVVVLSGLCVWKPVQFRGLSGLMGGYQGTRLVHFAAMAGIAGFVAIHVVMSLLVPRSVVAMVRGS